MNNNPNDIRFSLENLNLIFKILTILIQNREETIQQHFWEYIRQIVEGDNNNQNLFSSSFATAIQSSIFPYNIPEQTISTTTAPQLGSDALMSSQSLSDLFDYVAQNDTTVQYNNDSDNFQQSSSSITVNQLDNQTQFFNPLTESSHNDDPISSPQQSTQNSPKHKETAIVQEKEESEPKSKKSKASNPTENRVKKRRTSIQINESTGSTKPKKQRKTKRSSYSDQVHIMYRPVKPDSKTSLIFHKEDPMDNSVRVNLFDNQQNSYHTENQYTSTIPVQSQYLQQMHLTFEQWNNANNSSTSNTSNPNLFSNHPISQPESPQKSLTREQSPQNETLLSHFNELNHTEQLSYYIDSANDVSTEHRDNTDNTNNNTDSADIDLILGIGDHIL
ncbi:hypothetical protein C1645_770207 [Glomus cerebriforme]|uniref:Uncharacterized protein n=1 Tax=Glomus cerebriforme TaxID=658196 RepID=A0A397T595_9GLOM|nr:hypothetical protein C1645_770207 [Glomus cerebriforme]